ncbi:hydroxyacid dehydrogenase [Streptomyces sp. CA-278952]|uniref:hydroxyacid dehydrogenase n=1 Tax=Streptomyces sp. CA-278952 TaxID=2980556 RepID=UPI00236881CF|nr:hydroxyacid dehydrogenase [Streptomyces sp. CA-278952]WDG29805.1 hydroxyacid dehydrogenase [Streptomyces sp. CA-278952]
MTSLYVSDAIHTHVLAQLREIGEVHLGYGPSATPYAAVQDRVDAVMLRAEQFTADKIEASPRLKIIARHGVGTDNVDIHAATRSGVWVTVTPGSNARSVAEHVFALTLALARRIPAAAAGTAAGQWSAIKPGLTGFELHGRTLGLFGFGRIAFLTAEIARGFGMPVLVCDPYVAPEFVRQYGAELVAFDELITQSDVLSLHAPLTAATKRIIDADAIARMRPGTVLINTARGALIDEAAVLLALESGHLGGAALDVIEGESADMQDPLPHSDGITARNGHLDNLIVTPHVGGQTTQSLLAAGTQALQCIQQVLTGGTPQHAVNHPASAA